MIDYRTPDYKNRRELLIQYTAWQYLRGDVDPAIWMMNYMFNRQEYNKEQRLWYVWLYANSYQLPQAYVMANEFPDYDLVDLDRLTKWNDDNYHKLRYQVDCRYSKGKLPAMFESYRETIGDGTQNAWFMSMCGEDREANFKRIWDEVIKFHDFGRYKCWFYMQALRDVCGIPIDIPSLLLGDGGSESHRDGLCRGLGKDEWCKRKVDGKKIRHKFTKEELDWLEEEANGIIKEANMRFGLSVERLGFETVCCAFKKFFRNRDGRYPGYYLDRQFLDITDVQSKGWDGIEWSLLWEARKEMLHGSLLQSSETRKEGGERGRKDPINKEAMSFFLERGEIDWRGHIFEQQTEPEPNIFDILG